MFMGNWKKELFTLPNLLSLFRLALLPVYVYIYLHATRPGEYLLAGSIMAFSCFTDLIDGKIARAFNMVTNLGKILDPLADKVTQFTLTLCFSLKYPVLQPVLMLFLVKELFQLVMGLIYLGKGKMLPGALMAGKVCTTVLFVSLITLVLMPDLNAYLVNAIALTDSAFLILSFISYILAYYGKNSRVQDLKTE